MDKGAGSLIVIKVGGGIIEDAELMQDCIEAIGRLVGLGYFPVIVHGGGPQISQALESLHEDSVFRDGLRVTSQQAISLVAQALTDINQALVHSFTRHGIPATGLSDVFLAEHLDQEKYGEVGRVIHVAKESIEQALSAYSLPIVSCLAHDGTGVPLNANGDDAAAELVAALRPLEYASFTPTGGVNGTDGGLIRHITAVQAQRLKASGQLDGGMYKKVVEALRLVQSGTVAKIVIVHPRHLIEELFSEDGYGTIITG
jgi:N-acetyl-gamma-glutamyl-phosphate reductase/acetylglutamate kinase